MQIFYWYLIYLSNGSKFTSLLLNTSYEYDNMINCQLIWFASGAGIRQKGSYPHEYMLRADSPLVAR